MSGQDDHNWLKVYVLDVQREEGLRPGRRNDLRPTEAEYRKKSKKPRRWTSTPPKVRS